MSTNDKIEDALTRHHIFVQRYAKGREKEAAQFIRGIIKRTASYLDEGGTEWSDNRLKKTLVDLTGYVNSMGDKYNENVITEMTKFAEQEADFNYQVLDTNVNVSTSLPAPNQIQAAILVKPLEIEATTGYAMRQALASFTTAKATQIAQLITDGYVLGETTEQIVQRILGIEGTQRRQAETLARTITNHMSSAARELTMRENEDVLDGWKWVATLDTRTTLICGTRDGKVYPLDGDVAFPPAHFNCRSTAVFNVKDEYDLGKDLEGQRPSRGADGTKQIGANTSYEEWLRKQPPEFQDEILGKDKADLFRKGNVPFDRFVDERGNPVSLDRLKELDQQFNGMPVAKAVPPISTVKAPKPVVAPKVEPVLPKEYNSLGFIRDDIKFEKLTSPEVVQSNLKSPEAAITRISSWVAENAKDQRYSDTYVYKGMKKEADGLINNNLHPDVAMALESCIDDVDKICNLFNIPRIRGIGQGGMYNAAMGDGVLYITNNSMIKHKLKDKALSDSFEKVGKLSNYKFTKATKDRKADKWNWFRGRPHSVSDFVETDYERFRITILHELGHHVHQRWGLTVADRANWGAIAKPPAEQKLLAPRVYTNTKIGAASGYGDTNRYEWFAENFAMYFSDNHEYVDEMFEKLIKELLDGANG